MRAVKISWGVEERGDRSHWSERILSFLIGLREHNPDLFSQWYHTGMTRGEALSRKVPWTVDGVGEALRDTGLEGAPLVWSAWNGGSEGGDVSLMITIGGTNPIVGNGLSMSLPSRGSADFYDDPANSQKLRDLLSAHWSTPGKSRAESVFIRSPVADIQNGEVERELPQSDLHTEGGRHGEE